MKRKGDEPGYYLSAEFWADRYRDQITGNFTTRESIQARQAKAALEAARRAAEETAAWPVPRFPVEVIR